MVSAVLFSGTQERAMKTLLRILTAVLGAFALLVGLVVTFRAGAAPVVAIRAAKPVIGAHTPVVAVASAPGRGLVRLQLEVEQDGRTQVLARKTYRPLPPWAFFGARTERAQITAEVGPTTVPGLKEGEVRLRLVAVRPGTWLRHPSPVVSEIRLPVRLRPPALSLLSAQHYVAQGGSGVVVYRAGPTSAKDGVRAGAWFFPGGALPGGGAQDRFALFGMPWDLSDATQLRLVAEDDAGNRAELSFVDRFFPKPSARTRITLDDAFMGRVVPEILRQSPGLEDRGKLLDNYLQINRDLRKSDAEELAQLSRRSTPRFLWRQAFLPLRNAQVESSFADHRTYVYEGREVDEQFHLGFDLAVVERTPVPAANRGVVLLARYFGIYGNAVVLDHGYGLMSLYGHLSSIDVSEGQEVERGAILGRTGATGLAGGDHLHFTTLVGGLPVNPREWWDAHWIHDRVAARLGAALPFEEGAEATRVATRSKSARTRVKR
jgi:murein DD-endopeptidase MepM/ murein hydrolase activator NlpD